MSRRPTWKKAPARAALEALAQDIAEFFGVPVPPLTIPAGATAREWEWRIETLEVWTKAGRAELNISLDSHFGHMYFRFDDPARAVPFDDAYGRLNRHSGKWNSIASGGECLDLWRAELRRDFRRVAEQNPPADEVATYRAKEAARAALWNSYLCA